MKITFFGTQPYDRDSFDRANAAFGFEFNYHRSHLNLNNVALAQDTDVVCIFVNDTADAETIDRLAAMGVKLIALRCACGWSGLPGGWFKMRKKDTAQTLCSVLFS